MTNLKDEVSVIIFGASGDLNKRKLMPALAQLFKAKAFGSRFHIIGYSRTDFSDEKFREHLRKAANYHDIPEDFFNHVSFLSGRYDSLNEFIKLA